MRVSAVQKPINRSSFSTVWVEGTVRFATTGERCFAGLLFVASAAATLTIAVPSPLAAWGYALVVIVCAAVGASSSARDSNASGLALVRQVGLWAIASCGALQLLTGATVYRYATFDAWTRIVALIATVAIAESVLLNRALRALFLKAFVWFAAIISVIGVLTYYTSPGKVLWIFPSPYPDTWGPFLSRNNFAAFLELAFPVALWLGLTAPLSRRALQKLRRRNSGYAASKPVGNSLYLLLAAWMLAAGFASASRAGSALLLAEAIVILSTSGTKRMAMRFGAIACLLAALVGIGTLLHRWDDSDPLRFRREMQQSALEMVRERPIRGFGIGTFARVYPAHAHFDLGASVEHAHNDWLEWAAEGGLPYALAWVVVAVSVVKPAVRSIWGLGVLAVFLHAFVDYPFARFGVSAWTMTLIGALCADEMREVPVRAH